MVDVNDYTVEKSCKYKGDEYLVRDNGAILRKSRPQKKKRQKDDVWTFGVKCEKTGYMLFCSERVHRIVATAFHGEPPTNEHVVDHIDTNRVNNRPSNLRWLTRLENAVFNEITRKKIEFITGVSIFEFLKDPARYRHKFRADSNLGWMGQVTEEESRICRERLIMLYSNKSFIQKSNKEGNEERRSARPSPDISKLLDENFFGYRINNFSNITDIDSLTKNAKQRNWRTPTEFLCCPPVVTKNPILQYMDNLSNGVVFTSNKYGKSCVIKFDLVNEDSIIVMTESENEMKPYSLAKITFEDGYYIHKSIGSFFEENGAEEFFSHEIGVEWVGEHSFDYYCS